MAASALALATLTALLSLAAAGDNVLPGDVAATQALQRIEFSGIDRLERAGYALGSQTGIYAVATAAIIALALARKITDIALIMAALALRSTNPWIKELIASPRPPPDLVHVAANATGDPGSYGFPSGHVMGAALIYGTLIYLARAHIRRPHLYHAIYALAPTAIAVTALSRIYSGAHWPSDAVGGLLWGCALLFAVIVALRSVERRMRQRPGSGGEA